VYATVLDHADTPAQLPLVDVGVAVAVDVVLGFVVVCVVVDVEVGFTVEDELDVGTVAPPQALTGHRTINTPPNCLIT
jgi:hypothetical protein